MRHTNIFSIFAKNALAVVVVTLVSTFSISVANAVPVVIGDTAFGGGVDTWRAIMVVGENDGYTNTSGVAESFNVTQFDFRVGVNRGRVTPFVVRVDNAGLNIFTLLAIGDTRSSGVDYLSTGDFSFDFSSALSSIVVNPGDLIAPGFLDADAAGNSAHSVIPFTGGDAVFLTGGPSDSHSGDLLNGIGGAPTFGANIGSFGRNYSFNITLEPVAAPVPEPSTLLLLGSGLAGLWLKKRKSLQTNA